MKRYGDNVTSDDLPVERCGEQQQDRITVMIGGCGYGAGTFNRLPVNKSPRTGFRSLLQLIRKKSEEEKE